MQRNYVSYAIMVALSVPGFLSTGVGAASEPPPKTTTSFLQHAVDGQQSEIHLGQMALQKAESAQVKQFGARMIEDHQKARQELQHLASKRGLSLISLPTGTHTQLKTQLEKLSGKDFDRAYITTMLREHTKEKTILQQHALVEQNLEVRQWAAGAVPLVEEHLTKAKTIASSLGIPAGLPTE